MTQRERWRNVVGYEGLYIVSDQGRVMSLPRLRKQGENERMYPGRFLILRSTPSGYLKVTLYKDSVPEQISVHRVVMDAFVGQSDLQVNHKDENKKNNCLSNLEYMTASENTRYSQCKPVECFDVTTGDVIKKYEAMNDVKKDGHCQWKVSDICNGKYGCHTHHGLGWRFIDADICGEDSSSS